ncbi:unnamed protein product [Wuchereria bancrofti]|nr:unnamed protein product [Wuchereria bancrofti]
MKYDFLCRLSSLEADASHSVYKSLSNANCFMLEDDTLKNKRVGEGNNRFIDVQTYSIFFSSPESNRNAVLQAGGKCLYTANISRGRWAVYDVRNNDISRSGICNEEDTKEGYRKFTGIEHFGVKL